MSKARIKSHIHIITATHINNIVRDIEKYYGLINLIGSEYTSYKLGIKKIETGLSKAVLRTYYEYGGR
jgi:polysaccharide deacetylase 2 family uncharacterized protein YibQ